MICSIISTGFEKLFLCKNENEEPYVSIKHRLKEIIWKEYVNGTDLFYVNCEYGIPLLAAEIICALKIYNDIHINIIVPYENQCEYWSEGLRDRYYKVHEKADFVCFAKQRYTNDCYKTAEKIMVSKSDKVFIFYGYSECMNKNKAILKFIRIPEK